MNDLKTILECKNYEVLALAVAQKTEYIAQKIGDKMQKLDQKGLIGRFILNEFYSNSLQYRETHLCIKTSTELRSLQCIGKNVALGGDLNCIIQGASVEMAADFLNSLPEIISRLGEIENEKAEKLKDILNKVECINI